MNMCDGTPVFMCSEWQDRMKKPTEQASVGCIDDAIDIQSRYIALAEQKWHNAVAREAGRNGTTDALTCASNERNTVERGLDGRRERHRQSGGSRVLGDGGR